ncbi:MAG: HAD family phosphatase [Bacteroidales bacterium]|nr:HAD family phosphatase [Bacteroidales bacterium]
MENIKNIIFDFGGVICNINHQRVEQKFKELGIKDFEKMYSHAVQNNLFEDFETGDISPADFRNKIRELLDKNVSDSEIDDTWNTIISDIPEERIKLLESLKMNYRIFLLSNSNIIHYDVYLKDFQEKYRYNSFDDIFEKAYFSFHIGMRKPNLDIYEYVLKNHNLNPSETLFIDDSLQNIDPAKQLGIKTYFLEEGEEIVSIFNNEKLKVN